MSLFLILSFICFLLFIHNSHYDAISRGILYFFVSSWHICLIGAILSTDIFYPIHRFNILLLWAGMLCFVIGFNRITIKRALYDNKSFNYLESQISKILSNKLLLVVFTVFAVYMGWCYVKFFAQIQAMGMVGNLRSDYFNSSDELYGPVFRILQGFLFSPGVLVLSALLCYSLLRKRGLITLILALGLLLYHSLGGGRVGYIAMIVDVVLIYFIFFSKNNKIKFKFKWLITGFVTLALLFVIITFVTSMRNGAFEGFNTETFEKGREESSAQVKLYSFGPIVAFDCALTNESFIKKVGGYTYGGMLFGPLLYLYRNVTVNMLHMPDFEQPYIRVAKVQQDTQFLIGPGINWNALYTWNLNFYVDFGIIGILLLNYIIGLWFKSVIKMFYRNTTVSAFLLICIMFRLMVFGLTNTTFNDFMLWVLIFALYYSHKQEKRVMARQNKLRVNNAKNPALCRL